MATGVCQVAAIFAAGVVAGTLVSAAVKRRRRRLATYVMMRATVRAEKLGSYLAHHMQVWQEVEQGLRRYGVERMAISRDGRELVMFCEMREGATLAALDADGSPYRMSHPRVREWEEMMDGFFDPGWGELEPVYSLPACGTAPRHSKHDAS